MTRPKRGNARKDKHTVRLAASSGTRLARDTTLKSPFKPLSENEQLAIHRASLSILETTGMANATPQILDVALASGCCINADNRLCFPASLVEDILTKACKSFVVHARNADYDFEAKSGQINLCTGGAAVSMLDHTTQTYRPSALTDLYDLSRLADTLENIQWFARPVVATDIADMFALDANTIIASAAGTQKHIATSICNGDSAEKLLPLLDLLAGGDGNFRKRPFCTVHATTVVSPLTFAPDTLDVVCHAVNMGMPIHSQTGPQAGATAPAALAGTLVQCCAEGLASLCIINMLQPGYPVVIGNWAFVSDLRTGAFSGGGGEQALLGAASGQMSNFYGIPGGMGAGMTDSKLPDIQAGFEKAYTMLLASLSGGGFIFESAGMLASLLGCSLQTMVIDNDMLSSIRRIARGIEVNDDTLSIDLIKETATGAGHYLAAEQTMALMETEFHYPELADRASPQDWMDTGCVTMWDKATLKVEQVLAEHQPWYIDKKTDRQLRDSFPVYLKQPNSRP